MLWIAWTVIVLCTLASFYQFARLMGTNIKYEGRERRDRQRRWRSLATAGICDVLCALALGWLLRLPWLTAVLIGAAFFGLRFTLADAFMRFTHSVTGRSETVSLKEQAAIKARLQVEAASRKKASGSEVARMLTAAMMLGGVATYVLFTLLWLISRMT